MRDVTALLDLVQAFGTPVLVFIGWVVYRIKVNDLPHIVERIDDLSERISRVEGAIDRKP